MADVADAVNWQHLLALDVPCLGYADGYVSAWPAEAHVTLGSRVVGWITVLANERYSIFDSEAGNAGTVSVATAIANRLQIRLPSTAYTNGSNLPGLSASLRSKGIHWTDSQFWPEPGCYLWAASPGTTPGRLPPWCPVAPVAVQDRWVGPYDLSTTFHGWPLIPTPKPPPPTPAPKPPPPLPPPEPSGKDVPMILIRDPIGHVWTFDGASKCPVTDQESLRQLRAAGLAYVSVTQAQANAIPVAR